MKAKREEVARIRKERQYQEIGALARTLDNARNRIYNHFERLQGELGVRVEKEMIFDKEIPALYLIRDGADGCYIEIRFYLKDEIIHLFSRGGNGENLFWNIGLSEAQIRVLIEDLEAYIRNDWQQAA